MQPKAAKLLLDHYDANARSLPWRSPPGSSAPDPYIVWLSEVMLQQTTVATVIPRFRRFIARWPNVEALAAADDKDVLSEWAGLGYYARARNLIACAREVVSGGGFPQSEAGLRELPGLGSYTAAAIAAIAFGERATVVDTNVSRVIARYHAIAGPLAESRDAVRKFTDAMTPVERPGDFAQAMMDLGATICRPNRPDCAACPLCSGCKAYASGNPKDFPERRTRPVKPHRHGIAWWTQRNQDIWMVRRPAKGLLGGMAALPGSEWQDEPPVGPVLATVSHGFTHFTLDLHIKTAEKPVGDGWWQPLDQLSETGLPTLYRKAIGAVIDRKAPLAA